MRERLAQELQMLRQHFPGLEYREDGQWFLLPRYGGPEGIWKETSPAICFQAPPGYPGQKPYGFYVRLPFALVAGGEIKNSTASGDPPFEGEWLKFSWDMPEWQATADLESGYNLLNWALSFRQRLEQGS
jgi:hypothetical protein